MFGRAGSMTLSTASTAIGDSSDEYCDTTLDDSELRAGMRGGTAVVESENRYGPGRRYEPK